MDDQAVFEELSALLAQNGVDVRSESIADGAGGLCVFKGKKIVFVDSQAPATDSAVICAHALQQVVDIEKIYVKPQVRDFLEKHRHDDQ